MTPGIHLLHKSVGPTSFSLVQACIEAARAGPARQGKLKICHGGTLDPFACGLLLMLAGPATRLFDYLHDVPKVYRATVRWGIETDNGDPGGRTVFAGDPAGLQTRQLDDTLATFVGWREQIPPATSAKRIDGERAYLKAHRGETFEMPASRVYLHEARWLAHEGLDGNPVGENVRLESQLELTVRGGFYVRSLARDLGQLLGCGAHLTHLHRTAIGPWRDPGPEKSVELHGRDLIPWAPTRLLSDQEVGDLRKGLTIAAGESIAPDWRLPQDFPEPKPLVRGFHLGKFVFLLQPQDGRLHVVTSFRGGL
jgi:tRNA pseudouridine55 synthase